MNEKRAITAVFLLIFIVASPLLKAEEKAAPSQLFLRPPVEYKSEDLPEPFQLEEEELPVIEEGQEAKIQLPDLTIQGIVWGGSFPQAIINNKVVKKGDTIQGAQIIDINENGLTVSFQGKKFELPSPATGNVKDKVAQKNPQEEGGANEK